jgi:hypothetical protein
VPGCAALSPLPLVASSSPTVLWNVAPETTSDAGLTTSEMPLTKVPLAVYSMTCADPWKPAGHAVVVDQVAWVASGPVAGDSCSWPGPEPTAASANPAVTKPALKVMPIIPRIRFARQTALAVRQPTIAPRAERPSSCELVAMPGTYCADPNRRRTRGEK